MKLIPASAVALAALLALSGCITVQVPPSGSAPSAAASAEGEESLRPAPGAVVDCDSRPVLLNQAGATYRLSGNCGTVTIEGQDITVDLDGAAVVEIRGDRVSIDADMIGALSLSGQNNSVDADSADSATVAGDRNDLELDSIGSLTIDGNDNRVDTDQPIGTVADNGSRNLVTTDD